MNTAKLADLVSGKMKFKLHLGDFSTVMIMLGGFGLYLTKMVHDSILMKWGFFQALCHNTIFVFQMEFVKAQRPFLTPKVQKNPMEGLEGAGAKPLEAQCI